MNDFDDRLRDALRSQTEHLVLRSDAAQDAVRSAARTGRIRMAFGTGAVALVAAVGAFGAANMTDEGRGRNISAVMPHPLEATPTPTPTSCPLAPGTPPRSSLDPETSARVFPSPPPDIAAAFRSLVLPDPAPGFPIRRMPDRIAMTGYGPTSSYWTSGFYVDKTPALVVCQPDGAEAGYPTGPQAGVSIIFADLSPEDLNQTITGSRTVLGQQAQVTTDRYDNRGLVFHDGPLTIWINGSPDTTIDELVALGNSLRAKD